jgi:glutathione S-transferase
MLPLIVADIHERVDPADDAYFREMMEKIVRMTLEEARAKRDESVKRLTRALEPMQALLKRQAWICGAQPAYGDYILFSVFQWARVMSPQDVVEDGPMSEWRERMLDLHDGFARNVPTA